MKTYSEKLRDPRWQKMRLKVMERDGFTCQFCWAKDKTLNVHHKSYSRGRDPWDYPGTNFLTLCDDCHKKAHQKPSVPLELLVEQGDAHQPQKILCPVCRFNCVHLEGDVEIVEGNDNYDARPGIVRGGVILIKGWCEAGHHFDLAFGFHKGSTYAWSEKLPDLVLDKDIGFESPKDMR